LHNNIKSGAINYIQVIENGGAAIAAIKSALSNCLGIHFYSASPEIFDNFAGDCLITVKDLAILEGFDYQKLGVTVLVDTVINNQKITLDEIIQSYTSTLEKVFPTTAEPAQEVKTINYLNEDCPKHSKYTLARPRVFIPIVLGANCEYDMERAFRSAGAEVVSFLLRTRSPQDIKNSVKEMAKLIKNSQIIAFAGGISSIDETGGSGRFIASVFQDPILSEAISELVNDRDGLIIGIGGGFEALLKLGLLPFGKICQPKDDSPTLTTNNINRHVSTIARVRICSVKSPWLAGVQAGDIFGTPISTAEGKFAASMEDLKKMEQNGQIFSQFVDDQGNPSAHAPYNPTGSIWAIEGIISCDGKILGRLGHIERCQSGYKNIDLPMDQKIFESGTRYFK
jgi:phosphoribosylformylglycinamidine synthase